MLTYCLSLSSLSSTAEDVLVSNLHLLSYVRASHAHPYICTRLAKWLALPLRSYLDMGYSSHHCELLLQVLHTSLMPPPSFSPCKPLPHFDSVFQSPSHSVQVLISSMHLLAPRPVSSWPAIHPLTYLRAYHLAAD